MLPCGCEPCLEGGYGDDGRVSRYSMEWCDLHKHAEALREALEQTLKIGHKYRMDWSDFDGRTLLRELAAVANPVLALVAGGGKNG